MKIIAYIIPYFSTRSENNSNKSWIYLSFIIVRQNIRPIHPLLSESFLLFT